MKIILSFSTMVLLGLSVTNARGPCGCKPVFEYCANDYTTYHSICEYKCKHPSTPFHDWYILYNGPCISTSETTTRGRTTTKSTVTTGPTSTTPSTTSAWQEEYTNSING
ncbi:uncharacterized protein LOC134679702 [Cydia fagiglandana]|uniref:uncharacterized protein LOC134679702 n=1 Tax=Cydia fagiglandana TaxID=1458189 RepID=UPI002FEDF85A